MPGIAWWPGRINAGMKIEPAAMTIDILPTLAAITGGLLPEHKIDGIDISSLLFEVDGGIPDRFLYFWNHGMNHVEAVRYKNWKYHSSNRDAPMDATGYLYDVSTDIEESNDVKANNMDLVQTLIDNANAANDDIMTGPNSRRN